MTGNVDDSVDGGESSDELGPVDVVVVGGGPSGCSAGVFTGRYGLDTVIFDRGNAALRRCAYLENYLGFPGGVDVDTFYELMYAHAEEAGCTVVADTVDAVDRDGDGFVVETQDGRSVATDAVVAATWYDGEYLRPLGGDVMFETHDHDGEEHEHFDPEYADEDGRTPVDGLYVASPAGERSAQSIVAAGRGAHVARCLLADVRRNEGVPEGVESVYDWLRRDSEFSGEWDERDRWREWFEDEVEGDPDVSDDRFVELRERYIDRAFDTRVSQADAAKRGERGVRLLVEAFGVERVLDALPEEVIRSYVGDETLRNTEPS